MQMSDAHSEPIKPLFYEFHLLPHVQLNLSTWSVMQNLCCKKIATVFQESKGKKRRQKEKGKKKEWDKE